ncbi:MAG: bifunctional hydroxymethylpyrimidine kinase/phosphomethylpyrimidine kinase [Coriobacteriales bacterium]|jgi:hydroxymethylpyrimidine/phosphomethylpyrimidine kinase
MTKSILIIAGSDSIAGAGMQIDLKTAAAHGVYGTCAVTAVTAQSTTEVRHVVRLDPTFVCSQVATVFSDIVPDAIKIGMLGSSSIAHALAEELAKHPETPVVLDPVLVATTGGELTSDFALPVIKEELIARAALVTPNLPEAEALTGVEVVDDASAGACAERFFALGARAVLIKGGHAAPESQDIVDRLYASDGTRSFHSKRLPGEFHGTGCALSTAIACNLACGLPLEEAVAQARDFLACALAHPIDLGHGTKLIDPLSYLDVENRA